MEQYSTLLIVDDEPFNVEILREHLEDNGYDVVSAENGKMALEIVKSNEYNFDAILLDRMMPELDGIQFLNVIKNDAKYRQLPVIMQTAAVRNEEIIEGIEAGAYYYLTKPYVPEVLLTIVESAVKDYRRFKNLFDSTTSIDSAARLISNISFNFRTPKDVDAVVCSICKLIPENDSMALGLTSLMINAIEHGNLEIGYALKTSLVKAHKLDEEIETRLNKEPFKSRTASATFQATDKQFKIIIKDEGKGFNANKYVNAGAQLSNEVNGRGIAMARMISFDEISYNDAGNEVTCVIRRS